MATTDNNAANIDAAHQDVVNHIPNVADSTADIAVNKELIAQEVKAVNIPENLARVAEETVTKGTGSQLAEVAAILQSVGMKASDDPLHGGDPMKLTALSTPNARKVGMEMEFA